MSLGGWIRLLEAFKEPTAIFKVIAATSHSAELEKTYSLTRFCLLLAGLTSNLELYNRKTILAEITYSQIPRFGFLLITQLPQCLAKPPSASCEIVLYLNIQSSVSSPHWRLSGCTYPHHLLSWTTSALYLVDRPDPWVFDLVTTWCIILAVGDVWYSVHLLYLYLKPWV